MEKVLRRRSDSLMCQYLWDAITTIRNHKQLPSFDRIRRYMNRTHSMEPDKVEKYLEESTIDNLIIVSRKVGQKGSKVGVEQEGFRLPTPPDEPESHDWYCYDCHKSGEVVLCTKCYRVFHPQCLSKEFTYQPNNFVCSICQKRLYERSPVLRRMSREELNGLLIYVVARLKEKMPQNLLERTHVTPAASSSKGGPPYPPERPPAPGTVKTEVAGPNLSEPWRAQLLLHHQIDLRTMEQKACDNRYKTLYDFEIDTLTLLHNIIIFHGAASGIADMARQMLRDCQHDLSEIDQCKDCFRYALDKSQNYWFCKPCRPPHELVYVKEKGFPYWPAKVIRTENNTYHVRFFGNNHQTADVDKSSIKPISTNIHSLQMKRTSAWMKAYEELKKHQEFLANGYIEPTPPPPPPPPPPQSNPYQHAFQPPHPPSAFQQPYPHPFHPQPQFHPQFHQPHPILHPHQQHWEPLPAPEPHQRLIPGPLVPCHPHYQFPSPQSKKEVEAPLPVPATPKEPSFPTEKPAPKPKEIKKETAPVPTPTPTPVEATPDCQPAPAPAPAPEKAPVEEPMTVDPPVENLPSPAISSSSKPKTPKPIKKEVPEDMVSSSSQEHRTHSLGVQTSPEIWKNFVEEMSNEQTTKKNKNNKELTDKLKREHEQEKQKAIEEALTEKENEFQNKIAEMEETKKSEISATKRKQWCWTCEGEAIYHCCWNTAYCSVECQQQHWHKEHKKNCRRKCSFS